ncbi:MAG TPA: hypothetical protein VJP79_06585 [Nitrososphaera sp.]|nr:hypothetical protein [Nitrososphaera sp.]
MTEQKIRAQLKRALENSLDLLDEPSKRSLLFYLEKEFGISFEKKESPSIHEIEYALKLILGRGANIITEEFRKNLERQGTKMQGKRPLASRQGKTMA